MVKVDRLTSVAQEAATIVRNNADKIGHRVTNVRENLSDADLRALAYYALGLAFAAGSVYSLVKTVEQGYKTLEATGLNPLHRSVTNAQQTMSKLRDELGADKPLSQKVADFGGHLQTETGLQWSEVKQAAGNVWHNKDGVRSAVLREGFKTAEFALATALSAKATEICFRRGNARVEKNRAKRSAAASTPTVA